MGLKLVKLLQLRQCNIFKIWYLNTCVMVKRKTTVLMAYDNFSILQRIFHKMTKNFDGTLILEITQS